MPPAAKRDEDVLKAVELWRQSARQFILSMVLGLLPVVGMPLPLISYGGTAMLTAMSCFGLILSAYLHRDDKLNTTGLF